MTVTVIIVTLNRPDCMSKCLDHLARQDPPPDQLIVVDASDDTLTIDVVRSFDGIEYFRNDLGYGHMTHGRNIGLAHATGDIVAFVDDDAYVHEGWLQALIEPYSDPKIGGVGGRAVNAQPIDSRPSNEPIGRLFPNGAIIGNFAADPGRQIDVDHLIGCNMSWRRSVLDELGGLREDYPGTEVREETDIALRVRALGYRLVFQPRAVVTHVGAPQARGRRFNGRYAYYHARNNAMLLVRNFGPLAAPALRNIWRELHEMSIEIYRRLISAIGQFLARAAGLAVGLAVGIWLYARERGNPVKPSPPSNRKTETAPIKPKQEVLSNVVDEC